MDDDLALARLEMQPAHVQREGMEPNRHLAGRHHGDARNVDGPLHDDLGGLRHHGRQIDRRPASNSSPWTGVRRCLTCSMIACCTSGRFRAALVGTLSLLLHIRITSITTRAARRSASVVKAGMDRPSGFKK